MPRARALRKGKHGHDEKLARLPQLARLARQATPTVVDGYLT